MRFSLRSLMVVVLVLPPILAGGYAMAVRLMEPQPLPPILRRSDNVKYFAPGPKLSRLPAAQKAFEEDLKQSKEPTP